VRCFHHSVHGSSVLKSQSAQRQHGGNGGTTTTVDNSVSPTRAKLAPLLFSNSLLTPRINRSCTLCRRRKIRCNREKPCSNCRRSRNEACVYEGSDSQRANGSPPQSYDAGRLGHSGVPILPLYRDSTTNDSGRPSSSTVSSPSSSWSRLSAPDSERPRLKLRLRELETQLSRANVANSSRASTPNPTITETTSSRLGGAMHLHCERSSDQPLVIARSESYL